MEKHLDEHMFCRGNIIKEGKGIKPSPKVFDLMEQREAEESATSEVNEGVIRS